MKLVATCLLLEVFALIGATKPRKVNLNLETVLEFENKDNSADIQVIDNIQTFLEKVKNVIHRKRTARRNIDDKEYKFTDFIEKFIITLKSFEDADLEDTIAVLDDEIRKYHYRGCKFHELIENKDLRRFVGLKLDLVRDEPAKNIRRNLETILNVLDEVNIDNNIKEVIDYVNSLYRHDSEHKFKRFLNNLQLYRSKSKRANLDLVKVVREGIRNIVFDHYTNLNVNARRDLKLKLESLWKKYLSPKKVDYQVLNVEYTKSSKNVDLHYTNNYDNTQSYYDNGTKANPIESKSDFNLNNMNVLTKKNENTFSISKQYDDLSNGNSLSNDKIKEHIGLQDKFFSKKVTVETNNFIPVNVNDFPSKSHKKGRTHKDSDNNSKRNKGANTFTVNKYVADIENESYKFSTSKNLSLAKKHEVKKKYRFDIKNHPDLNNKISRDKPNNLIHGSHDDLDKDLRPTKQVNPDKSKHKLVNRDNEEYEASIHTKEYSPYYSKQPKINIVSKTKRYPLSTMKDTFKAKNRIKHRQLVVTLYPEDITTKTKRKTNTTRNYRLQTLWLEEVKRKQYNARGHKFKKTTKHDIGRTDYPISKEILESRKKTSKSKHSYHHVPGKHKEMHKLKSSKSRQFGKEATEKSRKFLRVQKTLSSDEGICIESFESANKEKYFRKSNDRDNLVQNGITLHKSNVTTVESISETKLSTAKSELVTEFADGKISQVADYGTLDFWEGTTKSITLEATTKPTTKINFTNVTKAVEFIPAVQLNNSTEIDENNNVTGETNSTILSTNTPEFVLRSSNDIKPNIINLKNQVDVVETSNLTEPFTGVDKETSVTVKNPPTDTTIKIDIKSTTSKKKATTKALVKSKTVTKQKAKMKTSLTPSKQNTKDITKNLNLEEKTSTTPEKAETINVINFLNQSETLNTEDERKKKLMHEKFMQDMAAVFAPTTKTIVTYIIPKEATDPFKDIEDELNFE